MYGDEPFDRRRFFKSSTLGKYASVGYLERYARGLWKKKNSLGPPSLLDINV